MGAEDVAGMRERLGAERYINLLTDFGFKRVFGTEPNKALLMDFLNTVLPQQHRIQALSFRNNENVGNSESDRKAIFDIYCESEQGERFIVELQKAKQNYFKDRSVYYSTFPIQEQALKGNWNFKLAPVYTIGILDFIFDDHKDDEALLHTVQLKNQRCQVFYNKLTFIYLELPKFQKTLAQLDTHFDKWLYLLKNLPELGEPPNILTESIFNQLFEVAELAAFSSDEQDAYENSLKYYRDLQNVLDSSRQEGFDEGRQEGFDEGRQEGFDEGRQEGFDEGRQEGFDEGRQEGFDEGRQEGLDQGQIDGQRVMLIRLLSQKFGQLPSALQRQISQLSQSRLEDLGEQLFELDAVADLQAWLTAPETPTA